MRESDLWLMGFIVAVVATIAGEDVKGRPQILPKFGFACDTVDCAAPNMGAAMAL